MQQRQSHSPRNLTYVNLLFMYICSTSEEWLLQLNFICVYICVYIIRHNKENKSVAEEETVVVISATDTP